MKLLLLFFGVALCAPSYKAKCKSSSKVSYNSFLDGCKEVPQSIANEPEVYGTAVVQFDKKALLFDVALYLHGIENITKFHLHGPATTSQNNSMLYDFTKLADLTTNPIQIKNFQFNETAAQFLSSGLLYLNVHTEKHPTGAMRGQIEGVEKVFQTCNPNRPAFFKV